MSSNLFLRSIKAPQQNCKERVGFHMEPLVLRKPTSFVLNQPVPYQTQLIHMELEKNNKIPPIGLKRSQNQSDGLVF